MTRRVHRRHTQRRGSTAQARCGETEVQLQPRVFNLFCEDPRAWLDRERALLQASFHTSREHLPDSVISDIDCSATVASQPRQVPASQWPSRRLWPTHERFSNAFYNIQGGVDPAPLEPKENMQADTQNSSAESTTKIP